jgi:hypothetical protein
MQVRWEEHMKLARITMGLVGAALAATALTAPAQAVTLTPDNAFVLDFIANGDGTGNLSNLPVGVYWQWDGASTLGMRMEAPQGSTGFANLWSFNVFHNGVTPGGLDSDGNNVLAINLLSVGALFSATSLGAYAVPVDAVEVTWLQPSFDPALAAIYIQLTIGGGDFPSDGYRMADYLGGGGTYANAPDFFTEGPFCAEPVGACAELTFEAGPTPIPVPPALPLFGTGLAVFGLAGWWRRRRASRA